MAFYRFAELIVEMEPKYPTLTAQAAAYLIHADQEQITPDIRIMPGPEYIDEIKSVYPSITPDQCEYMRYGSIFYRGLLRHDGMLLHSSAVALDGRAYLFSASPGTGKSTHTAIWTRVFGDRAFIINDDKPALRWINGVLCACGTPFSGKSPLNKNVCVPVGGICILERGETNRIEALDSAKAIPLIFEQTTRRLAEINMERLLSMLERVMAAVPLWRMQCNISDDAAYMAASAMAGIEI